MPRVISDHFNRIPIFVIVRIFNFIRQFFIPVKQRFFRHYIPLPSDRHLLQAILHFPALEQLPFTGAPKIKLFGNGQYLESTSRSVFFTLRNSYQRIHLIFGLRSLCQIAVNIILHIFPLFSLLFSLRSIIVGCSYRNRQKHTEVFSSDMPEQIEHVPAANIGGKQTQIVISIVQVLIAVVHFLPHHIILIIIRFTGYLIII